MKKTLWGICSLCLCLLLSGCGKDKASTTNADGENTAAVPVSTAVTETAAAAEAVQTSDVQTAEAAPMQLRSQSYGCGLEVPAGWTITSGAEGDAITEQVCVFQPETPNGDSISLAVQETAEDPDIFDAMTGEDMVNAYSSTFDTAELQAFEAVTVADCPAYLVQIRGTTGDITVEMTQLMVNRPEAGDSGLLYMLTYSSASGADNAYADDLTTHFWLE